VIKLIARIVWMGLLPLVGAMTLAYFIWEWLFFSVFFSPNYSFDRQVELLGDARSGDGAYRLAVVRETSSYQRGGQDAVGLGRVTRVTLNAYEEEYFVAHIFSDEENPLGPVSVDDRLSLEWVASDRARVHYCGVRLNSSSNVVAVRSDPWTLGSDVLSQVEIEFVRMPDCETAPPPGLSFPGIDGSVDFGGQTGAVLRQ
jgi:hypothetical protein